MFLAMKNLLANRLLRGRLQLNQLTQSHETQVTLFWAGVVGCCGGLLSLGFGALVRLFQDAWAEQSSLNLVDIAITLPLWQRLLVPTVGGILAGCVLRTGKRYMQDAQVTDFMEAIVLADGHMPAKPIFVRVGASLLSIASGGSIGREGSMVQLAAVFASKLGHSLNLPTPRLRLLVACGGAAGIASAYKAPIAGSLFVAEIVLGSISMQSFGPLVFSAVIATLTVQQFQGPTPLYAIRHSLAMTPWDIGPHLILGTLAGATAPFFLRLLRSSGTMFAKISDAPIVRLGLGGACVGVISILVPQVWGNGQSVVFELLGQIWSWQFLTLLLIAKILATAATVGSGAVGGVFTPTLCLGAALGLLFEHVCQALAPGGLWNTDSYALVGMGSFLAATTHAPLMAILMLFEMTLDYDIVPPMMLACVAAYYTATSIDSASIYTATLTRQRARRTQPLPATRACIADVLKANPQTIARSMPLHEIAHVFARSQTLHLYVVDAENRLLGVVSLMDIREHLNEDHLGDLVTAFDLMHDTLPTLTPEMGLNQAVSYFTGRQAERLPVVADPKSQRLIGSVSKMDLLLTLAHGSVPSMAEN